MPHYYSYSTHADGLIERASKRAILRAAADAAARTGEPITVYSPTGRVVEIVRDTSAEVQREIDEVADAIADRDSRYV